MQKQIRRRVGALREKKSSVTDKRENWVGADVERCRQSVLELSADREVAISHVVLQPGVEVVEDGDPQLVIAGDERSARARQLPLPSTERDLAQIRQRNGVGKVERVEAEGDAARVQISARREIAAFDHPVRLDRE